MATSSHLEPSTAQITAKFKRDRPTRIERTAPGLREVLGIWGFLGALTVAVLITYSRFPVSELYHVSREGLAGGFGSALVLINYPIAFIGIALMGFAVARLFAVPGALTARGRWLVGAIAVLATGLSVVAAFVVQQSDLDAKPSNAIPAIGVALALGLTVFAVRRAGTGERQSWGGLDYVRLAIIAVLVVVSLPWALADLGVFVGDIPLVGSLYMSREVLPGHTLAAVHLGHHHGFSGAIFAIVALILSRQLANVTGALRWPLGAYVALMLVYGVVNAFQDFWGEQIGKRGWTDAEIPSMIVPAPNLAWGGVLLATTIVAVILLALTHPGVEGGRRPFVSET